MILEQLGPAFSPFPFPFPFPDRAAGTGTGTAGLGHILLFEDRAR
jgi:hypothetical protein